MKFNIPNIPPTTNKSVRFPNNLITGVESAICGKECTFSAFVVEAVRVALANNKEVLIMSSLPNYYTELFNAVTKALAALEAQNYGEARELLIQGQQDAEELYMNADIES